MHRPLFLLLISALFVLTGRSAFAADPVANDDAIAIAEDSAATAVDVLANDSTAPDVGETLSVFAVTQPLNGTVALSGGAVQFTPDADFDGTTAFTYTISDGNGGTDTATVTVTMIPANDAPTANDDAFTIAEDSAATVIDVLANDTTAPDTGETLSVVAVAQPEAGTVTLSGGVVEFTPDADFDGTTTFTYTISDGNGGTDTATVTVTMIPANDSPTANDDAFAVVQDSAATLLDVVGNDTAAPDAGETLSVIAVTQPANATVTLSGGVVQYTPNAGFAGATTFTYTISDGNGGTDTADVAVAVVPPSGLPAAIDDAFSIAEDAAPTVLDLLANDLTAAGGTMSLIAVTQPANGMVALTGGVVEFTPQSDFNGTTTFSYTIDDGGGRTDTATVTITMIPVNDPPTANDDAFSIVEDAAGTVLNVLANDTTAPEVETLTVIAVTQPANGTVTLAGGDVQFTPGADFDGTTTFTYTIDDGNGGTDTAAVIITMIPVNDPPAANDDAFTVERNASATTFDVLANDTSAPDPGETLTVTAATQPANGTVALIGGVVQFTPAHDFAGTTTFTYTIGDGNGGTDTATVTILVDATTVSIAAPPSAIAGVPFSVTVTKRDGNGVVMPGYRGTVHFSATALGATLPPDYTFTAADAGVHTFTVTLTIAGPSPITVADIASAVEMASATVEVIAAAPARFVTSAPSIVAPAQPFEITVALLDEFGNAATPDQPISFASSDPVATLPPDAASAGTFPVTLRTLGTQTVTIAAGSVSASVPVVVSAAAVAAGVPALDWPALALLAFLLAAVGVLIAR